MKKIFSLILGLTMVTSLQAQNTILSPEVGYERAALQVDGNLCENITAHVGNGLRIGASAAYEFKNHLLLRSGLFYSHRGGTDLRGVDDITRLPHVKNVHLKTTDFLTIPLTVGYDLFYNAKWGFGIETGGYLATGLGMGNAFFDCINGEGSAGSVFKDSQFTVATPDGMDRLRVSVKGSDRVDTGLNFGLNVRFDKIKIRATYQLGLNKTIFDIAKPRTVVLTLAYDFKL